MNIKNLHKDDIRYDDISMISNNDILGIGGVVSGLFVVGVGTQTVRFLVNNYDKSKKGWWRDPQLVTLSAATAAFAVATATLGWRTAKSINASHQN